MSNSSKTKFEQNVMLSHEPEVKKLGSKEELNKTNSLKGQKSPVKAFLLIFGFFLGFIGLILLIRGIFLTKSPFFDNSALVDSINQVLNPNSAGSLKDVNINNNATDISTFGTNINSSFSSDYSDQPNLNIISPSSTKVGTLSDSSVFTIKYFLNNGALGIQTYSDGSISYFDNAANGGVAKLYIALPNQSSQEILSLKPGEVFISSFFSLIDKSFYYTYDDSSNILKIGSVNLNKKNFEIYTSNFLSPQTKILNITDNNSIYLKSSDSCYLLTLKDKTLNSIDCLKIKINNLDKLYWSNANSIGIYNNFITGEIYTASSTDSSRKVIFTEKQGYIASSFTYHDGYLYFLESKLVQNGASTWNAVYSSIAKLNLNTFEKEDLITNFPDGVITKIIPVNSSIYVVTNNKGLTTLLKYNPTIVVTPFSYPISYTLTETRYWEGIDLGNVTGVELLEGSYYF